MAHTFNPSVWKSHTFNPRTREVKTGRDIAEQTEGKRQEFTGVWSLGFGGDAVHSRQSEDHPFGLSIDRGKDLSSGFLLCFSHLQL